MDSSKVSQQLPAGNDGTGERPGGHSSLGKGSLLLLGVLAIAGVAPATNGRAVEKLRVAQGAIAAELSPTEAAQELGCYAAEGIDVEITHYSGGGPAQEAIAAGAADMFTNSPSAIAIAMARGVKQKIVAQISGAPYGFYVVVPADSPARSIADLNGKKIAISSKGATADSFASWAAKTNNIKLLTIPVGASGILPTLKAGQVDASVVWPTTSFKAIGSGEYRSILDIGAGMKDIVFDTWVASEKVLAANPDGVRRFLKCFYKAARHMNQNEEWALDFLSKYHQEADRAVVKQAYDALVKTITPDGTIDPEGLRLAVDLAKYVSTTTTLPLESIYTTQFTPVTQ